jgi:GH35 family endo-1,4-beta-xylanase
LPKRLIAEGAPITAVGIQGHWGLNNLPYEELDKAISDYQSLGLKVMITEFDISLSGQGGGQLNPTSGPTTQAAGRGGRRAVRTAPPTPDELKHQAEAYARFFQIFEKHKDVITRVTFWGLNDARSWRPGQFALIYDAQNKPKPAYFSILEAVKP